MPGKGKGTAKTKAVKMYKMFCRDAVGIIYPTYAWHTINGLLSVNR